MCMDRSQSDGGYDVVVRRSYENLKLAAGRRFVHWEQQLALHAGLADHTADHTGHTDHIGHAGHTDHSTDHTGHADHTTLDHTGPERSDEMVCRHFCSLEMLMVLALAVTAAVVAVLSVQ